MSERQIEFASEFVPALPDNTLSLVLLLSDVEATGEVGNDGCWKF